MALCGKNIKSSESLLYKQLIIHKYIPQDYFSVFWWLLENLIFSQGILNILNYF